MIMYFLNIRKCYKKITVKNLRKLIFENYYKQIGFTKKDSYYLSLTDYTLQLDIIKTHILPKNVCNMKLKSKKSKKYDEKFNLTRSSIKNKLFQITKEFKQLKF